MSKLGLLGSDIQILFGKIVSIDDDKFTNRARVKINGYTDTLETDKLPFYYPFFGRLYLPRINDTVPVIIFDSNFSTAFYGCKVDLDSNNLSKEDYENYLELYKRIVNDKQVFLGYTESKGIELINDKSNVIIKEKQFKLEVEENPVTVTKDKITLGKESLEPAVLGNKTVDELKAIIDHQQATIKAMFEGFQKIIAGCTSPFTAPIAAQLGPHLAKQAMLLAENSQVKSKTKTILSGMVSINK